MPKPPHSFQQGPYSKGQLEAHRQLLRKLTTEEVRRQYRELYSLCVLEDGEVPCPGPLQELVQAWKELYERQEHERARTMRESYPMPPPWRPNHSGD